MAKYWDQMFNATASATALTQLLKGIGTVAGDYSVPAKGRITKVRILLAGQAASSLLESLRVDLNCTKWIPNAMRFGAVGGGLRTAPAFPVPDLEWECDEPVDTDVAISGQYLFNVAAVTPNIQVFGQFFTVG